MILRPVRVKAGGTFLSYFFTLTDPHAAAEEQAWAARHAMNYADWARWRLEDFGAAGSGAREAQTALTDVIETLRPYAAEGDPFRLIEPSEWTGGLNGATMQQGGQLKTDLIKELESHGEKYSEKDMLFVTRDATGQIVWLEKGSPAAGLEHIISGNGTKPGHAEDFARAFGIAKDDIPDYLERVVTYGTVIRNILKPVGERTGFERIYYYQGNYHVLTGIGTNGYIVTAYPIEW